MTIYHALTDPYDRAVLKAATNGLAHQSHESDRVLAAASIFARGMESKIRASVYASSEPALVVARARFADRSEYLPDPDSLIQEAFVHGWLVAQGEVAARLFRQSKVSEAALAAIGWFASSSEGQGGGQSPQAKMAMIGTGIDGFYYARTGTFPKAIADAMGLLGLTWNDWGVDVSIHQE